MPSKQLDGLTVAILALDGFEQAELTEPRKALQAAGAQALVVSAKPGQIQGMQHDKHGEKVGVDLTLDKADPSEFDAVLLPGGALNADTLRMEPKAREFVKAMDRDGKPFAIICHAPWLLVSAGLVKGRKMTSYHTIQDDIRNAGGEWTDQAVVRDRNWVTSRQPDDIPQFNQAMVELFAQKVQEAAH
jgi:protease I